LKLSVPVDLHKNLKKKKNVKGRGAGKVQKKRMGTRKERTFRLARSGAQRDGRVPRGGGGGKKRTWQVALKKNNQKPSQPN